PTGGRSGTITPASRATSFIAGTTKGFSCFTVPAVWAAQDQQESDPMGTNSQNNDPSSEVASAVEEADKDVARSAARHRHHPVVKTLGAASEIADQIPLSIVCAAMIGGGAIAGRPQVTQAGLKMMTAHVLANSVKRIIKNNFKRTRPKVMIEEQTYECEAGESEGGHDTSFPSGHTAGAVAVATVMARDLPQTAVPALAIAAMIAGIQVPRGKHYPIDVAAGAVLGLAAACVVHAFWPESRETRKPIAEHSRLAAR
ncbi:phosphatase PAP2 family protein, partial [Paracoccus sp. S4493]|uniref:phosphatase PAP2 family protein n=1 Tax=Paracoccus sp. S4493 TaxID=579490 RepID=UPI000A920592